MHIALRPYFTAGVVIVGTSVLVVSPMQIPQRDLSPASSTVAVAPMLAQRDLAPTDPSDTFARVFQGLGDQAYAIANWVAGQPQLLVALARAVGEDPRDLPGALSALVYDLVYLGPGKVASSPETLAKVQVLRRSLLAALIAPIVTTLADILPAPVGTRDGLIMDATLALAAAIAKTLTTVLPEPLSPGGGVVRKLLSDVQESPVDQFTGDFAEVVNALGQSARNAFSWVGGVPGSVEALAQLVAQNPDQLPGALGDFVRSVFALPDFAPNLRLALMRRSLLGGIVEPIVTALDDVLPAPLGSTEETRGLVLQAAAAVADVVNTALDRLPTTVENYDDGAMLASRVSDAPDPVTELTDAIHLVVSGLGNSAGGVLTFLGSVPGQLLYLANAVAQDPTRLPNALSSIAYGLLAIPDNQKFAEMLLMKRVPISLLDAAVTPLARNLEQLPAPIGNTREGEPGAVALGVDALTASVNGALRSLPSPLRAAAEQRAVAGIAARTPLEQFAEDFQIALAAAGQSVSVLADNLGAAPGRTVELTRIVAEHPRLLPRALSTVAWQANSTREQAVEPLVDATARIVPPPVGDNDDAGERGIVRVVNQRVNAAAEHALSKLPPGLPIGEQCLAKAAGSDPADTGVATGKVKRQLVNLHLGDKSPAKASASTDKQGPGLGKHPIADHIAKRVAERRAAAGAKAE